MLLSTLITNLGVLNLFQKILTLLEGSKILGDSKKFLKKEKFNFDRNPDKELVLIRKEVDDLLKNKKTQEQV